MKRLNDQELKDLTQQASSLLNTANEGEYLDFDESCEIPRPYLTSGHGSTDSFPRTGDNSWAIYQHVFSLYGNGIG